MATCNTAASIQRSDEFGTLAVGRRAEVSVLEVVEAPHDVSDGYETITTERHLVAVGCVRAGTWLPVAPAIEAVPV